MKSSRKIEKSESFNPVCGANPEVLILGTLPGKESLRQKQYYANSRNLFWKIIYSLFQKEIDNNYEDKLIFLQKNKIALWDICFQAKRNSSLDSDIKEETPNQIHQLVNDNRSIKIIAFNGQKAEKLYDKYFTRIESVKYLTLLSTSPANAAYSFEQKLSNWFQII